MRAKNLQFWMMFAVLLIAGSAFAAAVTPAPAGSAATRAAVVETAHPADVAPDPVQAEIAGWPGTLIVTILIFVGLFLVLSKTAWKPIQDGLKSRENAIRDSIEAANKAKADAERTTRELESRIAEAQRQSGLQLQQAKADAQKVADTIRAQAEVESLALKDRTLREIEAAKQQAVTEINTHAAELGMSVARKILQRNVTVDDQQRLVDESLAQMAQKN